MTAKDLIRELKAYIGDVDYEVVIENTHPNRAHTPITSVTTDDFDAYGDQILAPTHGKKIRKIILR